MAGSTLKYGEACVRFSLVIVLSVEKPAVTIGLPQKFAKSRSMFTIQEHCVGIVRRILPIEGSVIDVAQVYFGDELAKKTSYQLVPVLLICRRVWI